MKKVYDDAKDKNVGAFIVYGDTTDSKLYVEATGETKTQVTEEEVTDMFLKGRLVINVSGDLFAPVNVIGNKVTIASLVSSTVTLTEWTAKASS